MMFGISLDIGKCPKLSVLVACHGSRDRDAGGIHPLNDGGSRWNTDQLWLPAYRPRETGDRLIRLDGPFS